LFVILVGVLALALLPATQVGAHHGWSSFDTRYSYYVSGTLTDVRWGNPHTEVTLRAEEKDLPSDWAERELPPGASEEDGQLTMASARPYQGDHEELHLVLAGPEWMERWGLNRELEVGESIEVVGFLNSEENQELRPVMFWLADGQGVWQQLTAFPQEPVPASANSNDSNGKTDNSEPPSVEASVDNSASSDDAVSNTSERSASVFTWLVVGAKCFRIHLACSRCCHSGRSRNRRVLPPPPRKQEDR
jgi:hypothetical protein